MFSKKLRDSVLSLHLIHFFSMLSGDLFGSRRGCQADLALSGGHQTRKKGVLLSIIKCPANCRKIINPILSQPGYLP